MSDVDTAPVAVQDTVETTYFSVLTNDQKVLKISSEAARQAITLRNLIDDLGIEPGSEDKFSEIPVENVDEATMKKIIEWCEHHKDEEAVSAVNMKKKPYQVVVPDWDQNFLQMDNDDLFNLICAANYLDIDKLLDYSCKIVADMAKGKNPDELRELYQINTDEEDKTAGLFPSS